MCECHRYTIKVFMSQISQTLRILKQQLKAQGKTYADVAQQLALSEASVKRLFAEEQFSVQRLEAIAQMVGLSLTELFHRVHQQSHQLTQLSIQQEQQIAEDTMLLLVTACVINGYSFEDLIAQFRIIETDLIRKLVELDRLKIIELLPENKIRLLISANFQWLPNGPIQRFFIEKIQQDFFNATFEDDDEQLVVLNGQLTSSNIHLFHRAVRRLAKQWDELIDEDRALPTSEKEGVTVVLANRKWEYSVFERYRKSNVNR